MADSGGTKFIRKTKQRAAVREALAAQKGFVSAQELYRGMKEGGSTVGLATVYRTLTALAYEGEADFIHSMTGEMLFRVCGTESHHHHLICRGCGRTEEFEAPEVEGLAKQVAGRFGFSDVSHVVELQGLCGRCRENGVEA